MNVAPHFPLNITVEYLWSTPLWATELISRILREYDDPRHVHLAWRRSETKLFSSGHITGHHPDEHSPRIVITAGSILVDQRHALLHEIAHLISRSKHTAEMYAVAWKLYRQYHQRHFAHDAIREALYRPTSLNAPGAPRKLWILDSWAKWPYHHLVSDDARGIMDNLSALVADRPRRGRKRGAP